jgi:hypothetical protein
MALLYRVRALDLETEDETFMEGSTYSYELAITRAEEWAQEFHGGDDVTWLQSLGTARYHVGRVLDDGTRENASHMITVEEYEVDDNEDAARIDVGPSRSLTTKR